MCNLNYNEEYNRIEIQQRIFYDDLEKSLRIDLQDEDFDILAPESNTYSYDSLFSTYINNHITLEINDNLHKISFLEYEVTSDAIVMYMYVPEISAIKKIKLFSSVLFELFEDQSNITSVQAKGIKKSGRFNQGSRKLEIIFD